MAESLYEGGHPIAKAKRVPLANQFLCRYMLAQ